MINRETQRAQQIFLIKWLIAPTKSTKKCVNLDMEYFFKKWLLSCFFFTCQSFFFFFRIQSFFLFFFKNRTPKWDAPYELLGDRPGPRNYCNRFLSFHTRKCLPQENFQYDGLYERFEHTWADLRQLEIFSRAIFRSTLEICENSVFSDYELLGIRPGPRKYCNKFLSFHTLQFY